LRLEEELSEGKVLGGVEPGLVELRLDEDVVVGILELGFGVSVEPLMRPLFVAALSLRKVAFDFLRSSFRKEGILSRMGRMGARWSTASGTSL